MIGKALFGYDIFISYSRKDSVDYALQLAQILNEKGFVCYLDQLSSNTPGEKLPQPIKNTLRRCTAFVIIGSEGSQHSEPIAEEVKTFLLVNNRHPIIPVNINGAIYDADWFPAIKGLAMVDESAEDFSAEKPSEAVISRIANACTFTKKNTRLRNITKGFAAISMAIVGIALLGLWEANRAGKEAARLNKENSAARDTIAVKQENIKSLQSTYETKKKQLDSSNLALRAKQNELAGAQQNIERLDIIGRSSALIAKGAKLADRKPNEAIEYLKQALKLSKDPQILAVALSMSDKALCTRELKLGSEIHDIDINSEQTSVAVLTQQALHVINTRSFTQTSVDLPNSSYGGEARVQFLDDGNILLDAGYVCLYKVNEREIVRLDSIGFTEAAMSANSNYYLNIGFDTTYLMSIKGGLPVVLNQKLGMKKIDRVTLSDKGNYFAVEGDERVVLCDASANIIDTLKGNGTLYFAPDETFLVNMDFKKLQIYFLKDKKARYENIDWLTPYNKVCFSSLHPSYFSIWNNSNQIIWLASKVHLERIYNRDAVNRYSFTDDGRIDQAFLYVKDKWSGEEISIRDFDGTVSDFVIFDKGRKLIAGDKFGMLKLFDMDALHVYEQETKKSFINFVTGPKLLYTVCSDSVSVIDPVTKGLVRIVPLSIKCKQVLLATERVFFYTGSHDELVEFNMKTFRCRKVAGAKVSKFLSHNRRNNSFQYKGADGYIYQHSIASGTSERLIHSENRLVVSADRRYMARYDNKLNTDKPEGSLVLLSIVPGSCVVEFYDARKKKLLKSMKVDEGLVRFLEFDSLDRLVVGIEKGSNTHFYHIDTLGIVHYLDLSAKYAIRNIEFDYLKEDGLYAKGSLTQDLLLYLFGPVAEYVSLKEKVILIKDGRTPHKSWFWDVYHDTIIPIVLPAFESIKSFNATSDYKNVLLSTGKSVYVYNRTSRKIVKLRDFYSKVEHMILSPNDQFFITHDMMNVYNLYAIDGTLVKSFKDNPGNFTHNDRALIVHDPKKDTYALWPLDPSMILYK
jgi:hypothetical protein